MISIFLWRLSSLFLPHLRHRLESAIYMSTHVFSLLLWIWGPSYTGVLTCCSVCYLSSVLSVCVEYRWWTCWSKLLWSTDFQKEGSCMDRWRQLYEWLEWMLSPCPQGITALIISSYQWQYWQKSEEVAYLFYNAQEQVFVSWWTHICDKINWFQYNSIYI